MAVSASFTDFVIGQLDAIRHVHHKRMFGGVGMYAGEWFFAVMDNDTLFFKVDDATRPAYEEAGMPPFAPIPGKPPMRGYYQVPISIIEDAERLTAWARDAIDVAKRAAPTRKSSKSRARRG